MAKAIREIEAHLGEHEDMHLSVSSIGAVVAAISGERLWDANASAHVDPFPGALPLLHEARVVNLRAAKAATAKAPGRMIAVGKDVVSKALRARGKQGVQKALDKHVKESQKPSGVLPTIVEGEAVEGVSLAELPLTLFGASPKKAGVVEGEAAVVVKRPVVLPAVITSKPAATGVVGAAVPSGGDDDETCKLGRGVWRI